VGTLEAGKRADLVLIAGNPLVTIGSGRNVRVVATAGRAFTRGKLWESVGFLAPPSQFPR
jgi:imidazolonepropionase-like amidohydrolase